MKNNFSRRNVMVAAALAGAAGWTSRLAAQSKPSANTLDVKIINSSATTQLAFQKMLVDQDLFEEYGLAATTVNVADGGKMMAALVGADADICMTSGFGQLLPAVERGAPVRIVAGGNLLTSQGVLTNKPEIQSIADLKGRNIGTGPLGALEQQLMVAVLLKHGVDLHSVRFINVGNTADIYRAIAAGVVDAGPVNVDVYDRLKGPLRIIDNFWTDLPEYPYLGSYASVSAITYKREALIRTLAVYCKAYRFLMSPQSKEPYVKAYTAAVGGANAAVAGAKQWEFFYKTQSYSTNLLIPDKSLEFLQELNIKTNVQKSRMNLSAFSDMSLAHEAVKRLG